MNVFGLQVFLRSPYELTGRERFSAWTVDQDDAVVSAVETWLLALYWAPWAAPSVPVRPISELLGSEPPDDLRRADLDVTTGERVTVIYDVWENLRVVRLLYLE